MRYPCTRRRRLKAVGLAGLLNGVAYVEVRDSEESVPSLRQRTLYVRLLLPPAVDASDAVTGLAVRIEGGERITGIGVDWIARADHLPPGEPADLVAGLDELDHLLVVRTDPRGDFSPYTLRVVAAAGAPVPPADFDPLLSEVEFSFKVECPSDFDCAPKDDCPPEPHTAPPIDYLAKDYQGFRRIMLERMALLAPDWTERNPADAGVALVEMLASVADELSYRQDAVSTEAYLQTARSRISLRRHARLIDYRMHDGCNARAWVHLRVEDPAVSLDAGTRLVTRVPGLPPRIVPGSPQDARSREAGPVVFETIGPALLDVSLNELRFYTWGELGCCLPRGATSATLRGHLPALRAGAVLVLGEKVSPTTRLEADADPTRRVAVRLVEVTLAQDPSAAAIPDGSADVTEIRWHEDDALPFPLCLDTEDGAVEVSFAWGNIVLADHGERVEDEPLPDVRAGEHYRPVLRGRPLTRAVVRRRGAGETTSEPTGAVADTRPAPREALPWLRVVGTVNGVSDDWSPQPDLLGSGPQARDLVVETEHDDTVQLRFGDDAHGLRPVTGTAMRATYRVGNGVAGNVGRDAIAHAVTTVSGITAVANLLPAAGGVEPETAEEVCRDAPQAIFVQERAVTEADYAEVTERNGGVQRAAATFRWTGSWHTVFVTADRLGGKPVDAPFEGGVRDFLERYRMAGYDLEVDAPVFVPLRLGLHVCVDPGYFRADVAAEVRDVLSDRVLPDGRRGLFHPDGLTFGQPVYLSAVHAAVHTVAGVQSVHVVTFERQWEPETSGIDTGVLPMGRLEIARLDDDPTFPERGVLDLTFGGGS